MNLSEYARYDGVGLAELVRRGEVAPVELAELALRGIELLNPALNAVIESFPERTASLAHGTLPDGPFRGVPFLIKDLGITEKGVRSELCSRLFQGHVADHDSELTVRFREAGLVTLGRTTAPEMGYSCSAESVLNGATGNPWDTDRMAGGSSGGGAAAVAAGIVPMAHGNDGGGSIRGPASCCGLVGLKPTRGRTPSGPDRGESLNGLEVEFALTRSVRDSAALLDAVAGPGLGDPYMIQGPERPYRDEIGAPPAGLRIGFTTAPWFGPVPEPEIVAAIEAAAKLCADMGHAVVEASPAFDRDAFLRATHDIWYAGLAHGIDSLADALGRTPSEDNLERCTWACYQFGRRLKATDLLRALDAYNSVSRNVAGFFTDIDVLITPNQATLPEPLGTFDQNAPDVDAASWTKQMFCFEAFLPLFNATGQPAVSLPLYQSRDGLPIGVHFAARFGDEATLFRLASALEAALPWRDRRPPAHVANR